MKNSKNFLLTLLLAVSLICNTLLCIYIFRIVNMSSSTVKLNFTEHNTVIYCEKSDDINNIALNTDKKLFTVGDSKLLNAGDSVYFIGAQGEIKLSDYEGEGFIINSDGELLYSLNVPVKKQETVYITPSGKKYHTSLSCAGKTGFEITLETAKLLRTPCSICT